jgi:hypothetical protein
MFALPYLAPTLQELSSTDPLVRIAVIVILLIVAWSLLRFVLGLAKRVFTLGCGLILLLGLALFLWRFFFP